MLANKITFNEDYLKSNDAFEDELEICRNDLSAFIEKTFKTVSPHAQYMHNWHIDAMSEALMACHRKEIKRLIINIPPRYMKSIAVNVAFTAWALGQDPSLRIMSASYSKELSTTHSLAARFMIESEWYQKCFPGTRIVADQNQKTKFITTARGQRFATSVGATATGEGGNLLICDDSTSTEQAQSKIAREGANDWFDATFSTRLDDKKNGVIIVVMQRQHANDLTGHLLRNGGWEHLMLPAIFTEPKTISIGNFKKQVAANTLLHPEREDAKVMEQTKKQLGSYAFHGQYLQQPAPEGGGIFKREWIKIFPNDRPLPKFDCIIQSYDTALTTNTFSDPTAFTVWGIFEEKGTKKAMLLDSWQEKLEYPELKKKVQYEWQTRYGEGDGRRADFVLVEDKGSGISLIQDMQRMGIPVRKYNPGNADKVQRAHLVTYLFEAGLVYFPESDRFKGKFMGWAEEVLEQLMQFPNAEHDDAVDSTTQAVRLLRDMSWLKVSSDPDDEPIEENKPKYNPYGV